MNDETRIELVATGIAHAALLAALHRDAIDPAWQETEFAALLAQPGVAGWIAALEGVPAGLLLVRCAGSGAGGEAEILTLAVRPASRRRGIAHALLTAMFAALTTQNVARVFLEVAETNAAARALYDNHGFAPIGRRPAYYGPGRGSDALVLARELAIRFRPRESGPPAPC